MTLKRIEIETLEKIKEDFKRLENSLCDSTKLAHELKITLQSNQMGNLREGLRRVKKFVVDIDNRLREVVFYKETPSHDGSKNHCVANKDFCDGQNGQYSPR